jgi:hypothetical protein
MRRLKNECRECDGSGRVCFNCMSPGSACECGTGAHHHDCDVCDATGYEPDPVAEDQHADAIIATSDADALAGRFPKP